MRKAISAQAAKAVSPAARVAGSAARRDRFANIASTLALLCVLCLPCLGFAGCSSPSQATDEGADGIPPTPYSQGTDAPETTPSSPTGASTFAANLPDADDAAATAAQPLAIEETGWWAKDGYVHYGIVVRNPNDIAAANTVVRVTLYDADGTEQGSYESTLALVEAGQAVGFAGEAGDGMVPARVGFSIDAASTAWKDSDAVSPFAIEGFDEQDKLYFRYEVTGSIANVTDAYESTANLSVLLRDDAGNIVAGYTGSAYRIKAQRTKDFLVTMHSAPDHATTEVYAQPA